MLDFSDLEYDSQRRKVRPRSQDGSQRDSGAPGPTRTADPLVRSSTDYCLWRSQASIISGLAARPDAVDVCKWSQTSGVATSVATSDQRIISLRETGSLDSIIRYFNRYQTAVRPSGPAGRIANIPGGCRGGCQDSLRVQASAKRVAFWPKGLADT